MRTTTTNERERHYYMIKHKTKNKNKNKESSKKRSLFRALCFLSSSKSQSLLLSSSMRRRKEQREKRERKSLGFHIQLGFKAILFGGGFSRANSSYYYLSLRGPRERAVRSEKRNRGAAFICLSVFKFLFCFLRALYSNRQRHYI